MTVNYKSSVEYQRKLQRFFRLFPATVSRLAYAWGQARRKQLKGTKYPPELPNQVYVRTGRLANSWSFRRVRESQFLLRNSANVKGRYYSGYVVGRNTQAAIHQGRWWIAEDIVEEELPALQKTLLEESVKLLK